MPDHNCCLLFSCLNITQIQAQTKPIMNLFDMETKSCSRAVIDAGDGVARCRRPTNNSNSKIILIITVD